MPTGEVSSRFKRLLLATVASTYAIVLLGIYTAAVGAGLTCEARWPLCDGAVFGLFPANWPSFVEWFHRLVAMIGGFLIVGSAVAAWRWRASRRVAWLLTFTVVLVPIQIWLGAETVLSYDLSILQAHFLAGLMIFGAIVVATTLTLAPRTVSPSSLRRLAGGAFVLIPILVALGPHLLVIHTGRVQAIYYGLGLLLLAAGLVLFVLVERSQPRSRWRLVALRATLAVTVLATLAKLWAGRPVYSSFVETVDWGASGLMLIGFALTLWLLSRGQFQTDAFGTPLARPED